MRLSGKILGNYFEKNFVKDTDKTACKCPYKIES